VIDEVAINRETAADASIAAMHPKLQRGLIASFGRELGDEAASEAIAWALVQSDRVVSFANPVGYLYRVGQSWALRQLRSRPSTELPDRHDDVLPDIDLHRALQSLTENQRTCVVLIHGCGWSYRDVGQLLHRSEASIRNHLHRGLEQLRKVVPPRESTKEPTKEPANEPTKEPAKEPTRSTLFSQRKTGESR
jgi:DNA-directed RNA polymerase specialized sigma24 family protein